MHHKQHYLINKHSQLHSQDIRTNLLNIQTNLHNHIQLVFCNKGFFKIKEIKKKKLSPPHLETGLVVRRNLEHQTESHVRFHASRVIGIQIYEVLECPHCPIGRSK